MSTNIPIRDSIWESWKPDTLVGRGDIVETICARVTHLMEWVSSESHLREVRVDVACRVRLQVFSCFKATCKRVVSCTCTTTRYTSCFWRIYKVVVVVIYLEVLSSAHTSEIALRVSWRHKVVGLDTVAAYWSIIDNLPIVPWLLLRKLALVAILSFFHILMIWLLASLARHIFKVVNHLPLIYIIPLLNTI